MNRVLALLAALLLILPAHPALAEAEGYGTQTVMVYVVGSDLEGDGGLATGDISEMLRSGLDTQRMNVLVMTGGSKRWHTPLIASQKTSIFRIEGRRPEQVFEEPIRNMGEAETLSSFLHYGVENYPAESYGLVLWNHGGGPMVGFGVDDQHGGDGLTLMELSRAFEDSPFNRANRLEWLAFDACLMASLEVAALMAPYARFMVASEEVLPGKGFDYGFLGDASRGSLRGDDVSRAIIDRTYDMYASVGENDPYLNHAVTLSLLDLDRLEPVRDGANALFEGLERGLQMEVYSDIARRRDATKDYGRTATGNLYDLVDLAHLAENLGPVYPQQSARLAEALEGLVVYNRANVPSSAGLSIYFPFSNKGHFKQAWGRLYKDFGITPDYQAFLDAFGNILLSDSVAAWKGADAPAVRRDPGTGEYYVQMNPEQAEHFDRAEYYILAHVSGDEFHLMHTSGDVRHDGGGNLYPRFDGNILYLSTAGSDERVIPYLYEKENIGGVSQYQIPVLFGRTGEGGLYETLPGNLLAQIDRNSGQARINGAIADAQGDSMTGKKDFDLNEWSQVYLVVTSMYLTRAQSGEPKPLGDWAGTANANLAILDIEDGLTAEYLPMEMDRFNYYTIVSMIDTQGYVHSSELMPLSGERFSQKDVPPPERSRALEIEYPLETQQPVAVHHRDGLRATLLGIDFSAEDTADRQAPDTLLVDFLFENEREDDVLAVLEWLWVNGAMIPSEMTLGLKAGESGRASVEIPIAPQPGRTGLVDLGVQAVEDLRMQFAFEADSEALFGQALIGRTDEIRLKTHIAVGAGYEEPAAVESRVLFESPDVLIRQAGESYTDGLYFHLPLQIDNRSEHLDLIRLREASVNGIMAALELPEAGIQPGSTLHTRASILLKPTQMPEGMEEFQILYANEDSLEKLGISEIGEVMLRFALDNRERAGQAGRYSMEKLLPQIHIPLTGIGAFEQTLDTAGRMLYEGEGVKAVLLDSDPARRTLYLHNATPNTLRLDSFGRVTVDGHAYAENMPLSAVLSPGASAYVRLFSYLPGVEPQGRELSFAINAMDADYNRLLWQSEEITLALTP